MRTNLARAVTYGIVVFCGGLALRFTPQLPERKPAEVLVAQQGRASAVAAPWQQHVDTLERGETLTKLFHRAGLNDSSASLAVRAASILDARRIPAGMLVEFHHEHADSAPTEIVLHLDLNRLLHITRTGGSWVGREEHVSWHTDTIVVAGIIHSNLYDAVDAAAHAMLTKKMRTLLTWTVADIFEYKVDMSRDLQDGDSFRVMVERSTARTGDQKIGSILATSFVLSGSQLQAIRFKSASVSGDYFDQGGNSLRAAFLRAPLEFRRISSVFGQREHPILGIMRQHKGTDYAAAAGTPVRAIGDGVVVRKGWGNGYGNLLEVRHRNGFVTRYGHLRGYASGIHVGSRVSQRQTIAYVGMTGLATGPHLHFEVLVNGVQRDPRKVLKFSGGDPVPASERVAFTALRDVEIAALNAPATTGPVRFAAR